MRARGTNAVIGVAFRPHVGFVGHQVFRRDEFRETDAFETRDRLVGIHRIQIGPPFVALHRLRGGKEPASALQHDRVDDQTFLDFQRDGIARRGKPAASRERPAALRMAVLPVIPLIGDAENRPLWDQCFTRCYNTTITLPPRLLVFMARRKSHWFP